MNNPYVDIINLMKKNGAAYNPPSILLGEVISGNPLTITICDLQIDKDNLLIADYLLSNYTRQVSVNNGTPNIYKTEDALKQGDLVAIMPMEDRQKYIVLAKVVNLSE